MNEMKYQTLWNDLEQWSTATFGPRSPAGPAAHLVEEAGELAADPGSAEELADCLLLILDVARLNGLTPQELLDHAAAKLEINKGREWEEPDERGVIRHVLQPGEEGKLTSEPLPVMLSAARISFNVMTETTGEPIASGARAALRQIMGKDDPQTDMECALASAIWAAFIGGYLQCKLEMGQPKKKK